MTDKVSLTNLANLQNENTAVTAINANNAAITTAINNTLSRDGTTPNQMSATLDMNSNRIINLPEPASANEPARIQDLADIVSDGVINLGLQGPVSSTDNAIARYDGTTGKVLQDSGITISDTNVLAGAKVLSTGSTTSRTLENRFADAVNVEDYGAIRNDNTASTANAAAFAAAFAASTAVYCPDGQTYYTNNIVVPTTAKRLFGKATLVATGTMTVDRGLIYISGNSAGLTIQDVTLTIDTAVHTTTEGIQILNSSNVTVQNTSCSGKFAIQIGTNSSNINLINNVISTYSVRGIYVTGSSGIKISGNTINTGSAGSDIGISTEATVTDLTITNNSITSTLSFGILVADTTRFLVSNNRVSNTVIEGISTNNSVSGIVSNNVIKFDGTSTDFGISINIDTNTITDAKILVIGNHIDSPGASGIAVTGAIQRVVVIDNYIYNPNQASLANGSGVLLYTPTSNPPKYNTVRNNFIYDSTGKMNYQVAEIVAVGTPDNNWLGPNSGVAGTSGWINITGTSTEYIIDNSKSWNFSVTSPDAITGISPKIDLAGRLRIRGISGDTAAILELKPNSGSTGYLFLTTANLLTFQPGGSTGMTLNDTVLTMGRTGAVSQIAFVGSTSGTGTITSQAAMGSAVWTLPTGTGTFAVTTSSPLALNTSTGNLTITGAAGQVLSGSTPAFTATPTLGAAGTLGSLTFGNATSGLLTLQAVTGALGTVTVSLPAATDTLVGKATTDTLTNKTLSASVASGTWTTSGTWTLPAHTLGGTISGGGNQINNVIIGTSTPLAGTFTTLASTDATDASNSTTAGAVFSGGLAVAKNYASAGGFFVKGSAVVTSVAVGIYPGTINDSSVPLQISPNAAGGATSVYFGLNKDQTGSGYGLLIGYDVQGVSVGTAASVFRNVTNLPIYFVVNNSVAPLSIETGVNLAAVQVYVRATTASTSTTTGGLRVDGGAGIAGAIWAGADINVAGNVVSTVAAKTLVLKRGSNGCCGTFVANGITPVTVSNTNVAITDSIIISLNTVGGTVGVQPHVATITASTGFTVVCTASDTSTYNYAIIKNAA